MEGLIYRHEFKPYYKRILLLWGAFIVCLLFTTIITAWLGGIIGNRLSLIFVSSALQNICVRIISHLNLQHSLDLTRSPAGGKYLSW